MRSVQAGVVAVIFLLSATTNADIPPPDDYVEVCTETIQEVAGTDCVPCDSGYEDPEACERDHGSTRTHVCSTYGGSFHTELWCSSDGSRSDADIAADRAAREKAAQRGEDPLPVTNNNTGDDTGSSNNTADVGDNNNEPPPTETGGGDDEEGGCQIVPASDTSLLLGLLLMLVLVRRNR